MTQMSSMLMLVLFLELFGSMVSGQHASGTEALPSMPLLSCSKAGGCKKEQAAVTLDANWRWAHDTNGYKNCYKGTEWDATLCPDPATCASNCALEGVTLEKYAGTYGIETHGNSLEMKFVTHHRYGTTYGSRVYMMDGDGSDAYKMFHLKNREFRVDVDVAELPCGLNGAVYFVEMDKYGGKSAKNKAGAKFGTGYCDAQCPHDVKWIDGEANLLNWQEHSKPPIGKYGACCAEMDIWEANSRATAYTPHPCDLNGPKRCEGSTCGDTKSGERYAGVCDKDGCDFNSYRLGDKTFYGETSNFKLDTKQPLTVVTQFLTHDGTDFGDLSEIRRFYVQGGDVIPNSEATILGSNAGNSITDAFCKHQKAVFNDTDDFAAKGALKRMGAALDRGMVLALSLWDDYEAHMLWLDSKYPVDAPADQKGAERGPCSGGATSKPEYLRSAHAGASVKYWNLAVGEINTTFSASRRLASAPVQI